jgi:TonB family protein
MFRVTKRVTKKITQGATKLTPIVLISLLPALTFAQQSTAPAHERKVVARTAPEYPQLAQHMHIQGVVKVEAIVRSNGTVKSTRLLGGNPVLVDSALAAVGKWKFEATPGETTEVVQLTFASK